MNDVYTMCLIA